MLAEKAFALLKTHFFTSPPDVRIAGAFPDFGEPRGAVVKSGRRDREIESFQMGIVRDSIRLGRGRGESRRVSCIRYKIGGIR